MFLVALVFPGSHLALESLLSWVFLAFALFALHLARGGQRELLRGAQAQAASERHEIEDANAGPDARDPVDGYRGSHPRKRSEGERRSERDKVERA